MKRHVSLKLSVALVFLLTVLVLVVGYSYLSDRLFSQGLNSIEILHMEDAVNSYIQTVPVEPGSFEDRKSLPKPWAGLSGEEFKQVSGIDDVMFCHNGLFIAGAESFESTMKMAAIALEA